MKGTKNLFFHFKQQNYLNIIFQNTFFLTLRSWNLILFHSSTWTLPFPPTHSSPIFYKTALAEMFENPLESTQ